MLRLLSNNLISTTKPLLLTRRFTTTPHPTMSLLTGTGKPRVILGTMTM